jgi:hypothetical protein
MKFAATVVFEAEDEREAVTVLDELVASIDSRVKDSEVVAVPEEE